jgi:hypothetical protein
MRERVGSSSFCSFRFLDSGRQPEATRYTRLQLITLQLLPPSLTLRLSARRVSPLASRRPSSSSLLGYNATPAFRLSSFTTSPVLPPYNCATLQQPALIGCRSTNDGPLLAHPSFQRHTSRLALSVSLTARTASQQG